MVPARRTTDTRQARRWPRRMPRPRAIRASPAMAIERSGGHAGPEGEDLEHHVQPAPQRWGDGVEQVDDAGEEDGGRGPAPHPPGPPVGLVEVGGGRPRLAHRVGGDQRRVEAAASLAPGDHPLEDARRAELVAGQQHAHVELGPGLELDPADPLVVDEDRGQAQPAPAFLHHLGGGARRWRRSPSRGG